VADDPGLEILKAGAEGAASGLATPIVNAARAMVAAVLGDTVEALDDYAAVRITLRNERARQRLIETIALSKAMCDEAGIEPQTVGLKIARSILEHAAVEDDDGLHVRWAALLANASAGEEGSEVRAPFVQILAEIDSVEAQMLETLAKPRTMPLAFPDFLEALGVPRSGARHDRGFEVRLDNLERLNLVAIERPNEDLLSISSDLQGAVDENNDPIWVGSPSSTTYIHLTALGRAFLQACAPPADSRA
jgi:hypothetical protein